MTALATATPRLRKLVLMLSSDQDGEVVNAARAIGRTLQDAGSDWHCFADAISFGTPTNAHHRDYRHKRTGSDRWDLAGVMARACRSHPSRLTPREFDFVNNIATSSGELSPKQMAWLRAIFDRVRA